MTIKKLYEQACALGIENDELEEVVKFCKIHFSGKSKQKAMCGYCKNRNAESCPYPNISKMYYPACLDFENNNKANF